MPSPFLSAMPLRGMHVAGACLGVVLDLAQGYTNNLSMSLGPQETDDGVTPCLVSGAARIHWPRREHGST